MGEIYQGSISLIPLNHFVLQEDIEIPIPKYFTYENSKVLQEREKMLGGILAKMGPQETTPVSSFIFLPFCNSLTKLTLTYAVIYMYVRYLNKGFVFLKQQKEEIQMTLDDAIRLIQVC